MLNRGEDQMPIDRKPAVAPASPSRRVVLLGAGSAAALSAAFAKPALAAAALGTDPAPLGASTFLSLTGQYFDVQSGDRVVSLRLVAVVPLERGPQRPANLPDPFSLMFMSPWNDKLSAQIYATSNPVTGSLDMFITPVEQNLYEAPFN
jgi:Domain of unknown function (DUF6916)